MPSEEEIVEAIRAPGRYNTVVGTEEEARRIVQTALPTALELPHAVSGEPYPQPPSSVRAWFQVQPREPHVGNMLPHVKYEDWTGGKKLKGGRWGHLFFPEPR